MRKLLFLLLISSAAFSQNIRVDGTIFQRSGAPAPGANVAVCPQPPDISVTPCTPHPNLCSSLTDITCTSPNPTQADGNGNYHFYVPPTLCTNSTPCTYQFYGTGLTTQTLADQVPAAGGGSSSGGDALLHPPSDQTFQAAAATVQFHFKCPQGAAGTLVCYDFEKADGTNLWGMRQDGTLIAGDGIHGNWLASYFGNSVGVIASVGVFRLANTDVGLAWRNNAGTGDCTISKDNTDTINISGCTLNAAVNLTNVAGVRYISPTQFEWTQSPSGSLTALTPATVTLTPCPAGITGTDTNLYVYLSVVGTPEPVVVTGGTCTPLAPTGTLTFTPVNDHGAGYTIGSASSGIYEALKDATPSNNSNASLVIGPSNPPTSVYYSVFAPVTVLGGIVDFDGDGATVDCQAKLACFLMPLTNVGPVHIHGFRVGSNSNYAGVAITNTVCAANVSTITTTLNPDVGSIVEIQGTFSQHYWGGHTVATTSGASWTYTDTNCGGAGAIASEAITSGAGNAYLNSFIQTTGQGTQVDHISYNNPGGFTGALNHLVAVLNDQSFHFSDIQVTSSFSACTASYCPSLLVAPGPFSPNAAVVYADHVNATMNCHGNGFTLYNGNTAEISDSVIQGFNQYGVMTGLLRGGFGPTVMHNVYEEIGSCTNPSYTAASCVGSLCKGSTGLIAYGGIVKATGGEAPIGSVPQPICTGGGSTQYNYWIVPHDSVLLYGTPLWAMSTAATCNQTGNITVQWPRIEGTNTITYDVLRSTGSVSAAVAPYNGGCAGTTITACGVVTGGSNVAQCSSSICSLTDDSSVVTNNYAVSNVTYFPALNFWPGYAVLSNATDSNSPVTPGVAQLYIENNKFAQSITSVAGNKAPSVFAQEWDPTFPTGAWITTIAGNSFQNNFKPVGATLFQVGISNGGDATGAYKGRTNYFTPPNSSNIGEDYITIGDSNPAKTIATASHRPTWDAADTAICTDQTSSVAPSSYQLCLRAPVSISEYINSVADGSAWLERLTATAKTFAVPLSVTGDVKATGSLVANNNTQRLTTNFTTINNTSLQTVLTWTMPVLGSFGTAESFHCSLTYSQATAAVAVGFGIQDSSNNPQNIFANAVQQITVGPPATYVSGTLATLATTTATQIVSGTPGATGTNYVVHIDGTIEYVGAAGGHVVNIMVSTANGADAVTILRGSYCSLLP